MFNLGQSADKLYRLLTPEARYRIKDWLQVNGHGSSILDNLRAHRDAAGKKRLDNAMIAFTEKLCHASVTSIEGKKCLEIGTGFVPTDALCMYLLGASEIFTTDYNEIARFQAIISVIKNFNTEFLLESTANFSCRKDVRRRYDDFVSHIDKHAKDLEQFGIKYIAPFNLATSIFPETEFDLIYSTDVLEHISVSDISIIIENLASMLAPNGQMIHYINLRDHKNMEDNPFEFLSDDTKYDPDHDEDSRGNRLRRNHWRELFGRNPGLSTSIPWSEAGHSAHKPRGLLPEFRDIPDDDCFCSKIIISSKKNRGIEV
jgi:SAM-dependent methyltransferase